MAKQPMTVDQLATRMTDEFGALRKEMANGFGSLHERADAHMEAIGEVKESVTGLQGDVKDVKGTLLDHSHALHRIEKKLNNTIERVDDHGARLERL